MCEYMTMTLSGIPVCKDGKLCTLCVVGNKGKYNELKNRNGGLLNGLSGKQK